MEWRLAEAKHRLSEVVNRALTEGPQHLLRRRDTVIVFSQEGYQRLTSKRPSFKEFLLNDTVLDDIDLRRDKSDMREVEL